MSKVLLKQFIQSVITESSEHEQHRCFDGTMVPVESSECYIDVMARIADAAETRDSCPSRTDSREHYNGLLKVLRRKMRKAKKFIDLENI